MEPNEHLPESVEVLEGEFLFLNASARGKPADLTYMWSLEGDVIATSRELNLTNIQRRQEGVYNIEVSNIEGSVDKNISVRIKCKLRFFNLV